MCPVDMKLSVVQDKSPCEFAQSAEEQLSNVSKRNGWDTEGLIQHVDRVIESASLTSSTSLWHTISFDHILGHRILCEQ